MDDAKPRLRDGGWLAFALVCAVGLVVVVVANVRLRADSHRLLRETTQAQLLASAHAARGFLDVDAIASHTIERASFDAPAYQATRRELRRLADRIGAKYIYVLKEFDGVVRFVMDTDPTVDTLTTAEDIFTVYEPSDVHRAALDGRESVAAMDVADPYGSFGTGAVPLWKDGDVVGAVCVDIEDRLLRQEAAGQWVNTAALVFFVALALAAGTGLWRLSRRLRAMQDKLARMAHYDLVTGLPNRQYLVEQLEARLARHDRTPYALFFTDLDNFKTVNDQAGHDAGDALLRHIGAFLGRAQDFLGHDAQAFRPSAGRLNVTARIGGDEFVLLVSGVDAREEAARIAQTLLDRFRAEVIDENIAKYRVGLSIGAALFPGQSEDYHVIFKYADIAMYHAKRAGKNGFRIYEDAMPEKSEK